MRALPVRQEGMAMNLLDFMIFASFLSVIAVGFFSGVTKVAAGIFAIYFAAIASAAFYESIADAIRGFITSMNQQTSHLFTFVILFFTFWTFFAYLIAKWMGDLKFPRRIEIIDNIGGAALGVLVSGLAVTLAAILLAVMLQALNQTFGSGNGDSVVGFLHDQIENSKMVPLFLKVAPVFVRLVSPWFPRGLPPILSGGAEV